MLELRDFHECIRILPSIPDISLYTKACFVIAEAYFELGQFAGACDWFTKNKSSKEPDNQYRFFITLVKPGQLDRAQDQSRVSETAPLLLEQALSAYLEMKPLDGEVLLRFYPVLTDFVDAHVQSHWVGVSDEEPVRRNVGALCLSTWVRRYRSPTT